MSKSLLFLVAAFLLPMACDASVVIDDFDATPVPDSLVEQGTVSRTVAGGATYSTGAVDIATDSLSLLVYDVVGGGTFGGISSDFANGVSFSNSAATTGSDFEIALYADGVLADLQTFVAGGMSFNVDLSAASQLVFLSLGCGVGHTASLSGSFSAVPEPTSLILVGLACSGIIFRQRRDLHAVEG